MNFNCRSLVASVPFFTNADPSFVSEIVGQLQFEVYLPGDLIIKEGTPGTKMFFIQEGFVDIVANDGTVTTCLGDGSYFGGRCHVIAFTPARIIIGVTLQILHSIENIPLSRPNFPRTPP